MSDDLREESEDRALEIERHSESKAKLLVKQDKLQQENDGLHKETCNLLESEALLQRMIEKLSSQLQENSKVLVDWRIINILIWMKLYQMLWNYLIRMQRIAMMNNDIILDYDVSRN